MTSQSLNPKLESDLDGVSKQFIMKLRLNYLSTERRLIMAEKTNERPQNPKIKEAREHMYAARKNMHKVAESFLPEGTREHQRAARKEFLLGLRSFLDAAIEHTEKEK